MIDNKQPINTILNERTNERTNKIRYAHCLFEQSGTFKNEFKKLGYDAYDYDILNDYGETDYQIDLFEEIRKGYDGKPSIFDNISPDDVIMAFFPCTRFEAKIPLAFRGELYQQKNWNELQKLEYSMNLHKDLHRNYLLISMMVCVVINKGLKMIIENPYTAPHYLTTYWCIKPKVIDKNRRLNGDYMKKPTQFWFIGFEPKQNLVFEPIQYVEYRTEERMKPKDGKIRQVMRSEIHPQYANRFIRQYIIDSERLDVYGKIKETTDTDNEKDGV